MEFDYSQEKNHKCPYCPLSSPELERFKQHLVNCRKCNDMNAYVCMYYFGHVFPTQIELENHYKTCLFQNYPALYTDKKKIKLGKASKEPIMNEYYPFRPQKNPAIPPPPQVSSPVNHNPQVPDISPVRSTASTATGSRVNNKEPDMDVLPTGDLDVIPFYVFDDISTGFKFNLSYSFGLELAISTLVITTHKEISEYGNFFNPETFDEEQFKKFSSLYTLFIPENEADSFMTFQRKILGKKIGVNDSKATSHNEILIVATKDTEVIGKFVWTEIAFLVLPASQLLGIAMMPSTQDSFYKKERKLGERMGGQDVIKVEGAQKNAKEKLLDFIKDEKLADLRSWIDEVLKAQMSIPDLQDLTQTLDFIHEEWEKKLREMRYQRNQEMEVMKKDIVENRKYNKELQEILNQKEKKIQQMEENLERDKKIADGKYNRMLKNKLQESDDIFRIKKEEIDQEIAISQAQRENLGTKIAQLKISSAEHMEALDQGRRGLENQKRKIKALEEDLSKLSIKEKTTLKDIGLGVGAPKLSEFSCNNCKKRNKDTVFLPCRHMLKCRACCWSIRETEAKCEECGVVIEKIMDVKKVEYKMPFDEILAKK